MKKTLVNAEAVWWTHRYMMFQRHCSRAYWQGCVISSSSSQKLKMQTYYLTGFKKRIIIVMINKE